MPKTFSYKKMRSRSIFVESLDSHNILWYIL